MQEPVSSAPQLSKSFVVCHLNSVKAIYRNFSLVVLSIAALAAIAIAFYAFSGGNFVGHFLSQSSRSNLAPAGAHIYKNSGADIGKIALRIFYAVPKNKAVADGNWPGSTEEALKKISAFHELQFRGKSKISYALFPRPVILENDNLYYDSSSTNGGNPHALIAIAEELERRVFREGGDLFDKNFAAPRGMGYPVMGIVYEGVGAAGGIIYESQAESPEVIAKELNVPASLVYLVNVSSSDGLFLLNREFLTDPRYSPRGASILYHEFAHTLGIADRYEAQTDKALSDDIMGGGRREPIEMNYIDSAILKEMGVL